jgi:hypothetical protein
MAATHLDCRFHRDGEQIRSETVLYEAGARALTLVTTSSELGLQLYSSYLGDEQLEEALVAEVAESGEDRPPRVGSRRVRVPLEFLLYHRDLALQDHLDRFAALAAESEVELTLAERAGDSESLRSVA